MYANEKILLNRFYDMLKKLTKEDLIDLANSQNIKSTCSNCSSLNCIGWDSVPSSFELNTLKPIGTLKTEDGEDIWEEFHPNGTTLWSENAPISIKHNPYNRSDVCECKECGRKYLRYTEYGGYYVDERIRTLNPNLII